MVEGGMKLVKYLVFVFNLLFWLSGLGIIIVGAVIQHKYKRYLEDIFTSIPILLIIVGCIIAIIGFFGCCGAIKENYCMIITFAVLLTVIFILEIAAGIAAAVFRKDAEKIIENELYKYLNNSAKHNYWDYIQIDFSCCGVTNASDWWGRGFYNETDLPSSCCGKNVGESCNPEDKNFFNKPCWTEFKNFFIKNIIVVIAVGIVLAFIQVFGVTLACCLGRAIRKEYEVV